MDAPSQEHRHGEAWVSRWLHELEMARDSSWVGCSHSGGCKCEIGVVSMMVHPGQVRRDRNTGPVGNRSLQIGSPEGSATTIIVELHVPQPQLLTHWV